MLCLKLLRGLTLILMATFTAAYPAMNSTIVGDGQSLFNLIGYSADQTLTLLYRASAHGFGSTDFYNKCQGKAQTITIIKSTLGYVFGGYASVEWDADDESAKTVNDPNAFLFSLVNHENSSIVLHVATGNSDGVYMDPSFGPAFGVYPNLDLAIADASNTNMNSIADLGNAFPFSNANQTTQRQQFLAGSLYFQTIEIEVFKSNMPSTSTTTTTKTSTSAIATDGTSIIGF